MRVAAEFSRVIDLTQLPGAQEQPHSAEEPQCLRGACLVLRRTQMRGPMTQGKMERPLVTSSRSSSFAGGNADSLDGLCYSTVVAHRVRHVIQSPHDGAGARRRR